ncbi:MAG: AraC family transcriptional regulator ligand-binding domain-containing protein [Myxococcales bacterium]
MPSQPDPATVDTSHIHALEEALTNCGVSEGQRQVALKAAGAKRAGFWQRALQAQAPLLAKVTGDSALGLRMGCAMPKGAGGAVEYLLCTAPSFRRAHVLYERFRPLVGDSLRHEAREEHGYACLELVPLPNAPLDRVIEDFRLARMWTFARRQLGPEVTPSQVCFTYRRPKDLAPYERAFGRASFEFAQPRAGIRVPQQLADQPLEGSAPLLHAIVLEHAERLLAHHREPQTVATQVRAILGEVLHEGRPEIADVARQLGLGERTLRRRLAAEGTNYAELLDGVRLSLSQVFADTPVRDQQPLAFRLGFESASALRRARKRWAAQSPT